MMVNGVCLQAQGRDAAKSGDGFCIDSRANRVCLQAQNAMRPKVKKARVSWNGRWGTGGLVSPAEWNGVNGEVWMK
jgi:hypothetical protein